MPQTASLFSTMALFSAGFAVLSLPALVAAARGEGPWMVCAAISSVLSILIFIAFVSPAILLGIQFVSSVWGPSLIVAGLSWVFAWASILERRRRKAEQDAPD
jgi:hypothetical protein